MKLVEEKEPAEDESEAALSDDGEDEIELDDGIAAPAHNSTSQSSVPPLVAQHSLTDGSVHSLLWTRSRM